VPKVLRVALIGGSEILRGARRAALEATPNVQVVTDSDGFGLSANEILSYNFDVVVLDQRLPNSSAFDFVRAIHALAKINATEVGRFLVSSPYENLESRILAVEAGAVDAVFIDQGIERFVATVIRCSDSDADFGIRDILPGIPSGKTTEEEFAKASLALDILDSKEEAIIRSFCELKTDAQIAQIVQVPKLKVRQTISKAQNLLLLSTRSQLLLKLHELGELTL